MIFGEKKKVKKDDYGQPIYEEPIVDSSGNIDLKEGEYMAGDDIPAGTYDAEIDERFGEVFLNGVGPTNGIWQRLGISGVEKVRIELGDGDKLRVSDDAILTSSKEEKFAYEGLSLYPGIWYVGKDITPGRYIFTYNRYSRGSINL